MWFPNRPELPGAIFPVNFCKGHRAHAVIGAVAREIKFGNFFTSFIYRPYKSVLDQPEVLVISASLVDCYHKQNFLVALIQGIQFHNNLFIITISRTRSVITG